MKNLVAPKASVALALWFSFFSLPAKAYNFAPQDSSCELAALFGAVPSEAPIPEWIDHSPKANELRRRSFAAILEGARIVVPVLSRGAEVNPTFYNDFISFSIGLERRLGSVTVRDYSQSEIHRIMYFGDSRPETAASAGALLLPRTFTLFPSFIMTLVHREGEPPQLLIFSVETGELQRIFVLPQSLSFEQYQSVLARWR